MRNSEILRRRGRAEAVILLFMAGEINSGQIKTYYAMLDVDWEDLLWSADKLAKERRIPYRPFDGELYSRLPGRTYPARNLCGDDIAPDKKERWCPRCGKYLLLYPDAKRIRGKDWELGEATFYMHRQKRKGHKLGYSALCKEHYKAELRRLHAEGKITRTARSKASAKRELVNSS